MRRVFRVGCAVACAVMVLAMGTIELTHSHLPGSRTGQTISDGAHAGLCAICLAAHSPALAQGKTVLQRELACQFARRVTPQPVRRQSTLLDLFIRPPPQA